MSSYTSGNEEEAKAFEYWGKFVPDPPQGDPDMVVDSFRFSRLIIALTDLLVSSSLVPNNAMEKRGAKAYLNPEMMRQWDKLLDFEEEFTPAQAEYLDEHTRDKILALNYKIFNMEHDMSTRRTPDLGPKGNMPYLTRGGFALSIILNCMVLPDTFLKALNKVILDESLYIVDSFSDERFKYPIPMASLPKAPDAASLKNINDKIKLYQEKRAEILAQRRADAIATGDLSEVQKKDLRGKMEARGLNMEGLSTTDMLNIMMNQSAQNSINTSLNAAHNTQMMTLANQMALNAQMQAVSVNNAYATMASGIF
ncbi:unnamed protein product [Clonostachys byssicola]|uniref:DUF7514 domain-containing protein n=1 Tax=Clonostachys byssicola TaxID=160290 RepID=A0A9N9V2G9_9HYPO|nr:unnamed protein product [Clonostachys byssicola]